MIDLDGAKRTDPLIPVGHPSFVWRSGADVQSTWHRYTGWQPPSAGRPQFEEPVRLPAYVRSHRGAQ